MTSVPIEGTAVTLLSLHTDEAAVERVADVLGSRYDEVRVLAETDPDAAVDHVDASDVDCVICGAAMGGDEALGVLRRIRERDRDLPVVLYRHVTDDDVAQSLAKEAIDSGSDDVVPAGWIRDDHDVLASRVRILVDRYRTRRQLAESKRLFRTLVGNLPGMVYRCRNEPGWPMTFVSQGCRELVGYAPEALTDGDVSWGDDVIVPDDRERVWDEVQGAIADGRRFELDYQVETADGERKWVWERGIAVTEGGSDGHGDAPDENERVVALEGLITDVTDQRHQERRVELLNRVLRHNLRNRMNVVMAYGRELADEVDDEELASYATCVSETAQEVAKLGKTVGDIEDILASNGERDRPIDLANVVDDVAARARRTHPGADVENRVNPDAEWWVRGAEGLELALRHAVDNALEHADADEPWVALEATDRSGEGVAELRIRDRAGGIPDMELSALDDREPATDLRHGSGLGLWVMKWYAESVGGEVDFERTEAGTVVTFSLPVAEDHP